MILRVDLYPLKTPPSYSYLIHCSLFSILNSRYKENIVKRSLLFRERLTEPLETAIYWIDHVLKYKDTAHLRSASAQLTWYELYSVDVFVIAVIVFWIVVKTVKFILGKISQKVASMKSELFVKFKSWQKEKVQ